jgi:hypothetical protein
MFALVAALVLHFVVCSHNPVDDLVNLAKRWATDDRRADSIFKLRAITAVRDM